ncbi:MAG: DUF1700 domain-containing protein [Lachnospiraceae bacterium]|nr:DUF1700 domain-containing protein [Lachnospiraceae bacterium]
MNKQQFMQELAGCLRHLPADDRADALEYYSEYIDDLGLSDSDDVCARLGAPKDVARIIIAQTTEKKLAEQTEKKTVRGSGSIIWLVILGIFASPIALPIAIALAVIIFALVISVGSILLSFFVAGAAMVFAGVVMALFSFLSGSVAQVFVCIGAGLFIIGLGLLIVMGTIALTKLVIRGFSGIINRSLAKKAAKKAAHEAA